MAEIILDLSANTHKNRWNYLRRMMDEVIKVDTHKHTLIFKHQLFMHEGDNLPLHRQIFDVAYRYAARRGYKTTSSVFDEGSLSFLLEYDVPFVKIACRPDLYWLIDKIPRGIPVYVSCFGVGGWNTLWEQYGGCDCGEDAWPTRVFPFECVPKYPALPDEYDLDPKQISDHTVGLEVWYENKPRKWEKHLRLSDSTGPDAGPFAITPEELKEIL